MMSTIEKGILLGLGITSLTKKKAEAFVKEVSKKTKMSAKEGKKMVKQLMSAQKKVRKEIKKAVNVEVKYVLSKSPFATKADLKRLEKKLKKKK